MQYVEGGDAMTRQEMADAVDGAALLVSTEPVAVLVAAAAELRKSCSGCEWWATTSIHLEPPGCRFDRLMPVDGTGFCHEWSAK